MAFCSSLVSRLATSWSDSDSDTGSDNDYSVYPVAIPRGSIMRVVDMDSAFLEPPSRVTPCFLKEYDELLSQYTGYSIIKSADYYYNQYYV